MELYKCRKKQLVIFDFDNTIYLYKIPEKLRLEYERKLQLYFFDLCKNGTILAIASYNKDAEEMCRKMNIREYFSIIVGDPSFYEKGGKVSMMLNIQRKFPHVEKKDILYFDDDCDNVDDMRKYGVDSICVNSRKGIFT
jgi:HAD superfamily phosphatase (TIGR01681 family)